MKTEHLDLEIKKLTHSQNYEGITETQQKRLNEFIDIKKQLALCSVSKSVAKQYAEFCVRCDRAGLPLLEIDDYIKQYCC